MRKVTIMLGTMLAIMCAASFTTAEDAQIPEYKVPQAEKAVEVKKAAEPDYKGELRRLNDIIASAETEDAEREKAINEALSIIEGMDGEMEQMGAYIALAIAKSVN